MPTYDYVCDACEHAFEEFQSIKADTLKKCPACKKNKLRRLIGTGAGIIFKGSGFYETDYRSESYKKSEKADKADSEKKPEKTKESGDSKGKTKTESSNNTDKPKPEKKAKSD